MVIVIMGIVGDTEEKIIIKQSLPNDTYEATVPIVDPIPHQSEQKHYLRAEVYGEAKQGSLTVAATSAYFVGY